MFEIVRNLIITLYNSFCTSLETVLTLALHGSPLRGRGLGREGGGEGEGRGGRERESSHWLSKYVESVVVVCDVLVCFRYCDCFANGEFCREACNCHSCRNNIDFGEDRAKAIKVLTTCVHV